MRFPAAVLLGTLCCVSSCVGTAFAQQKAPASADGTQRYAEEPIVIEQYYTTVHFAADGTSERDLRVRVRVQSESGAQELRELSFPFDQNTEQLKVSYLRVLRADGSVANDASSSMNEVTAPFAPNAPAYTNYKEARIPLPDLRPGEILEYEIVRHSTKAPETRDIWYEHAFARNAIVLDERLEVDAPAGRTLHIESPGSSYKKHVSNGDAAYVWKRANLTVPSGDDSGEQQGRESKPPDVRLTSFASWQDVARWYAHIARTNPAPAPELTAKASELTRGQTTMLAKTEAIYTYVAQNTRDVPMPPDMDFHPTRSPEDIFKSGYADSEDEEVLLAAMLRAAGIPSDAALVSASRNLDSGAPSPSQFDHVITAVPNGSSLAWMDTTTGVAPFEMLAAPLRDRPALLIAADAPGKIVRTPADPPFTATQRVEIEANINSLGTLSGTVHYAVRGDNELLLRAGFRAAPKAQWKQLGQTILSLDGLQGEVTDVKPSDPLGTRGPFQLEIAFRQPAFLDWASAQSKVTLPLLTMGVPTAPANRAKPMKLGSPLDVHMELRLTLPAGYAVHPPAGVEVSRDYAKFQSGYEFEGGTLTAERSLDFTLPDLPAGRASDYAAFSRAVQTDQAQALLVENPGAGTSRVPADATAEELVETGTALLKKSNPRSAIPLLARATQLEPQHKQAWSDLGLAYAQQNQAGPAADAFRKQVQVNPKDARAWDYLGIALANEHRDGDASDAFHHAIEVNPLDSIAYPTLGVMLANKGDYAGAVDMFEKAAILLPDKPEIRVGLAEAYLRSGNREKAAASFEKACQLTRTPEARSKVASRMESATLTVPKACR